MRFLSTLIASLLFTSLCGCESVIYSKSNVPRKAVFRVPQTDFSIILEQYHAHLFLAEYERILVLQNGENEISRNEIAFDTGGYSRMNVYRTTPTRYFLQDISNIYEFDVNRSEIFKTALGTKYNGDFVGAFDFDGSKKWRFISSDERAEIKIGQLNLGEFDKE